MDNAIKFSQAGSVLMVGVKGRVSAFNCHKIKVFMCHG